MSWSILKKCHGFWLVLVANDVETEQIVLDEEAGYDPTYEATKLHFEDLAKRYGNPIIVLNLIKFVALIVVQQFFAFMLLSIVDGKSNSWGFPTRRKFYFTLKSSRESLGESWSVEGLD
ncbi:hypothetical protein AAG906_002151 [Vitis piasezkii]